MKQRMLHWVKDATYVVHGLSLPLGIQAHSNRGIAASQALLKGSTLYICGGRFGLFADFYRIL